MKKFLLIFGILSFSQVFAVGDACTYKLTHQDKEDMIKALWEYTDEEIKKEVEYEIKQCLSGKKIKPKDEMAMYVLEENKKFDEEIKKILKEDGFDLVFDGDDVKIVKDKKTPGDIVRK
jgi:hypothetical protein